MHSFVSAASLSNSPRPTRPAGHSPAPLIESLEDRRLLSAVPVIPQGPSATVTVGLKPHDIKQADVVIDWNATMLQAIRNAATAPTGASRVMAMVGVAVYDAVDGITHSSAFYSIPGLSARATPGASPEAAAIAAADTVLNSLYPTQKSFFDAEYQGTISGLPNNHRTAAGIAWGQRVGNAVIAWRSTDGSTATSTYQPAPPGGPEGVYELTPGVTGVLSPQWGQVTPWTMTSSTQFQPPPPPALDSAEYAASFNKTKLLGGTTSTARTADETQYAHFWADVPGNSVTPPGHWNEIAEHVSLQRHMSLEQNARMFGMLNMGLADAAICCWGAKYMFNLWRPVTAINDPRAAQINPATSSDPTWSPLWKTPNFPSYTSGHSTFSGTADAILTSMFGKNVHFTIGSDDMPGVTRSFTSFTAAANEAGESRVVGGIHFEFDNQAGLKVGRDLGTFIARNFLQAREGRR